MLTFQQSFTETFTVVTCYSCALPFGIPSQLYKRAVTDASGSIFCPACGKSSCWQESDAQRKIKQLETKLQWEASQSARLMQSRDEVSKQLIATKGVVTKLRKRVAAGVCPCCGRTFKQLSAHMTQKHPEYGAKEHA